MHEEYTHVARSSKARTRTEFEAAQTGRNACRTMQILALVAAAMAILLALWPSSGHDQLWLLLIASRMGPDLDPYRQVFEANPPLAAWLSRGVLGLAQALHLPAPVALKALTAGLAVAVTAGCWRLLRHKLALLSPARRWFLLAVAVLLFGAVPARDFAQRDHVLVLLVLPYLVLMTMPRANVSLRLAAALAAAAGVALKPHQALILLAAEGYFWMRNRRPRWLEPVVFLAAGILYLLAIVRITPEFLRILLPVLRDTYWANGALSFPQLLAQSVQLHVLAALAFGSYFLGRVRPQLVAVLLATGTAATIAFYLQDTGWYYHQLPALTLFALALAVECATTIPAWHVPPFAPWGAAALGGLTLVLCFHFMDYRPIADVARPRNPLLRVVELDPPQEVPSPAFYAGLPLGAPVMTLTPTVDDAIMPVELYHLTLAQRYPQFWMLPALLRGQAGDVPERHRLSPQRLTELVEMQQRLMREDLDRWHPSLILVERCQDPAVLCQAIGTRHSDLLAFFLADPGFRQRFSRYRLTTRLGPYDGYRLLR